MGHACSSPVTQKSTELVRFLADDDTTLTHAEKKLLRALIDNTSRSSKWYSIRVDHFDLRGVPTQAAFVNRVGDKVGHAINHFYHSGHFWIGFQYRKEDYDRDTAAGVNPVEQMVRKGYYD